MMDKIETTAEAAEAAAMRLGKAIHTDRRDPSAEQEPLPADIADKPLEQKSPAEWAYQRLILYIQNFEKNLDASQEVAMGFTDSGGGFIRIEGIGYFDPDIVTFYGSDQTGARAQLVQHVSQLNVLLRAMPKENETEEPRRIGFRLAEGLKDGA